MDFQFIEGRDFSRERSTDSSAVIINEMVAKLISNRQSSIAMLNGHTISSTRTSCFMTWAKSWLINSLISQLQDQNGERLNCGESA